MKKISILLAIVLALLPLNAFAAAGDMFLLRENDERLNNDYIQALTTDGDTLYVLGDRNLYTYRIGEEGLTAYDASEASYAITQATQDALNADADEDEHYGVSWDSVAFFCKDGTLYRLIAWSVYGMEGSHCNEASLLKIVLEDDGTMRYEPVLEHFDWTELTEEYGDYSYSRGIHASCVVGDGLLMGVYGRSDGMELYWLDMESGEVELVAETESYMQSMCAYKDDTVLTMCDHYNGMTSEIIFCTYDQYGNEEEIARIPYDTLGNLQSLAYDEESDTLYVVTGGMVQALNLDTQALTEIADMPLSSGVGNGTVLLNGGYYAVGSYEGLCIRNLDVSLRTNEITLRLYNGAYSDSVNKAGIMLGNKGSNIVVVSSNNWMEDSKILENMMNRIETPDIYVLYTNSSAYDAIYNRGYMADMNGSDTVRKCIESMYEGIQEKMMRDGDVVALPTYTYGNAMGINKKGLEQLGLTIEDVPTNWKDFLNWLKSLEDDHPEKMYLLYKDDTFESVKSSLFYSMFSQYVTYLSVVGEEKGFDSPELQNIMDVLDSLDFEKWGHEHTWEKNYDEYVFRYDENEVVLLEPYSSCALGSMYESQYQPILLSISPDEKPMLILQTAVAFINPFTKHYDEAVAYMECLAENLGNEILYSVSPEYNEPLRFTWYEENVQNAQEYLDSLLESYEQIEEQYKQEFDVYIQEAKEQLEATKNQWQISPEQIEWYHANSEYITVEGYNALYSGESSEELWTLLEQYFAGTLDSRTLLKQIDKKLQMMILEGR